MSSRDNIVLIGMPGSGKSTVGVVLAKKMGCHFVDCDLVIQEMYHKLLQELIEEYGVEGFWELEGSVIATGGSAVYGKEAMEHLRTIGHVIYLKLPFEEVESRLGDLNARGVTLLPGQDLRALYEERVPLYEKYAHVTVDCEGKMLREIVMEIAKRFEK